jgi:hypothetical protein
MPSIRSPDGLVHWLGYKSHVAVCGREIACTPRGLPIETTETNYYTVTCPDCIAAWDPGSQREYWVHRLMMRVVHGRSLRPI